MFEKVAPGLRGLRWLGAAYRDLGFGAAEKRVEKT